MAIIVKNLTYIYNEGLPFETVAVDDVSFEINDNEFVGIIGHTGSGKSTLIQHLDGLLKPKTGNVVVNGTDITEKDVKLRDIRRKIGLVFQYPEYQLFEETVEKDVAFGPVNLGLNKEEVEERVAEAIELVGLDFDEVAGRSPFELSGGQRRRIAIAGVIAMRPEVLIMDEPTAGLDPQGHRDILEMIKTIQTRRKSIVILVSHNMGDIARLADKVLVMHKGKLVLSGTPREVFRHADMLARIGLGLPPATQFMIEMKKRGADVATDILSLEEAEAEIINYLKGRKQ